MKVIVARCLMSFGELWVKQRISDTDGTKFTLLCKQGGIISNHNWKPGKLFWPVWKE